MLEENRLPGAREGRPVRRLQQTSRGEVLAAAWIRGQVEINC